MRWMKCFFCFVFFGFILPIFGQETQLVFYDFDSDKNQYQIEFKKIQTTDNQIQITLDSLKTVGYYTIQLDSIQETENLTKIYLKKGKLYKNIWVKNDTIFESVNKKRLNDSDFFSVGDLDSLKKTIYTKYEEKGYPFSKIQLKPEGYHNGELAVSLALKLFGKRKVDGVEVVGYEKLNEAYLKHNLGLKLGNDYSERDLIKISEQIQQSRFLQEVRAPQTLFAEDSTVVYLYVKKQSANYFDGIIGFGNDNNGDFQLNGNVQLELNNNFNGLETIGLNWISTPDRNTTLNLSVRIPYLFKSAIGSESQFELFRQDSVFVNTKAAQRFYYQINPNSNFGLNLSYENSNFVLNDNPNFNTTFNDYNKTGIGAQYDYLLPNNRLILEGKNYFSLRAIALQRTADSLQNNNQYEVSLKAYRLFDLGKSHVIKGQIEGRGLFSENDEFVDNELFRYGGFGSLRGFNEQSLVANAYGVATLEYRFVPNDGFFISLFGDYSFLENQLNNINENLLGIGTGFSFLTKIGVFNISYAVGRFSDTNFDFNNSKVHFGLISTF